MAKNKLDRRTFIKASLISGALWGCQQSEKTQPESRPAKPTNTAPAATPRSATKAKGKTVILGFDGVDPRLVERFIKAGDLPNLDALRQKSGLLSLASTSPPNSPVAWSTFATGRSPSEHGVFGFLNRNPDHYLPGTAPYVISGPRFSANGFSPAKATSLRRHRAWWDALDQAQVSTSLLFVPYAYPPPQLAHGKVLTGLGTPDARFTNSSFTFFTSRPRGPKSKDRVAGGRIVRLSVSGRKVETRLEGPRGPHKKNLRVKLTFVFNRKKKSVTIALAGSSQKLREGQRSKWFRFRYQTPNMVLACRVRFHVISVRRELEIYASPIQLDPQNPALPLGTPNDWVRRTVEEYGLPTVGWAHDTSAVNAGFLPKEVFLADLLDTMQSRAQVTLAELANPNAQVICSVFTGTDRAAHMFYRDLRRPDGGALRKVYRQMDRIVGSVRKKIPAGTKLVVLSDHGFHAFDQMLHVNTWLEQQKLLVRTKPRNKVSFLRGIDWSQTQAYSLGNGQIYANLQGRERSGIVAPDNPHERLLEKIKTQLLDLRDRAGQRVVQAVYPVYQTATANNKQRAPDLQIAFVPGWRSSWETSLGGAPVGDAFAKNPKAWCGDHAASDVHQTPGIYLSDSAPSESDPDLKDLYASILDRCGVAPDGSGKVLW